MTINSNSDRCNTTYEEYPNQPMHAIESQINKIIAKNPQIINSFFI